MEDLIELIARQTRPVITNRNPKHVRTVQFRPQQNVPLVRRAISHRVKRVEQKIEQDLLQLNLVAARAREIWIHVEPHAHVVQYRITVNEQHDFPDNFG